MLLTTGPSVRQPLSPRHDSTPVRGSACGLSPGVCLISPVLSCPVLLFPVLSVTVSRSRLSTVSPPLSCPVLSCPVLSATVSRLLLSTVSPPLSCAVLSSPTLSCR